MRRLLALLLALSAAACGSTQLPPPTAHEEVAVWLAEAPRRLAVEVDREVPKAMVRTRDHHVGQRVGAGVGGAAVGGLYTVAAGCAGGPIGCLVGVIVAPVGMVIGGVAGAAHIQSTDAVQPADAAGNGPARMNVPPGIDFPQLLEQQVVSYGDGKGRLKLHSSASASGGDEAILRLRITDLELFGDAGDDPSLALIVRVSGEVLLPNGTSANWGPYEHTGSSHYVSSWLKNDAALFRKELQLVARDVAKQTSVDLRAVPSREAVAKVAWARQLAADPDRAHWERVRASCNPAQLQSYLDKYPQGKYAGQAQSRLAAFTSPYAKVWLAGGCG
jgi:hypothetical protein